MRATAKFPLGDVATISAGHPVRGAIEHLDAGDVFVLQMRDVDWVRGVNWEGAARIAPPGKREPDYLFPGDIIFTSRGGRYQAITIAEVPAPAICAPNLFIIRVKKQGSILPDYVSWYMNSRPCQMYFQRSATGTNILNIRREFIEQLVLPVPSLVMQKTIVDLYAVARRERELLYSLIINRDQQMEALAFGLAECTEA